MSKITQFFQSLNHDQQVHFAAGNLFAMGITFAGIDAPHNLEEEFSKILHVETPEESQNSAKDTKFYEEFKEAGLGDEFLQAIKEAVILLQEKF